MAVPQFYPRYDKEGSTFTYRGVWVLIDDDLYTISKCDCMESHFFERLADVTSFIDSNQGDTPCGYNE